MNTNQPTEQDDANPESPTVVGTSRRDWLRRGAVAATPVVASLASAPVYAAGTCVLPSGFLSANTFTSRHPGATTCVGNMGPSYWASAGTSWPARCPRTTTFVTIFTTPAGTIVATTTLDAVLAGSDNFAKYIVAAFLNATSGTAGFPLTTTQVVDIWKSFYPGSVKSTLLVGSWTSDDTLTWLKSLML